MLRRGVIRLLFYPTLLWNVVLHRLLPSRRWWDRVDEHVVLGALPLAADVPRLQAEGVRAVLNMCAEYAGPVAAYERAGIVQERLPTEDFTPPTLQDVEGSVAFIAEHAAHGETVYVHCKAGRGRSATVVLCWFIAAHRLTPEAAQARLQGKRPHVVRDLYRRQVVDAFWRRHGPTQTAKIDQR
jgi:atypical dual specificity phosphatase